MSEYAHTVTIIVPEHLINEANHLACVCGEFAEDINTFTTANYQDVSGNKFAVISTVVKPKFLLATQGLPEEKPHAVNADRNLAQVALDSLGQPDGLIMIVDVDPQEAIESVGLYPVHESTEI